MSKLALTNFKTCDGSIKNILVGVVFFSQFIVPNISFADSADQCRVLFLEAAQSDLKGLLKTDKSGKFEFAGFTKKGLARLNQEANKLRRSNEIVNRQLRDLETIIDGLEIARSLKGTHVLNAGQHGAAKTGVTLASEPRTKVVTLNEWSSPLDLIGGQTREGAEQGRSDINVDAAFLNQAFGMVDEFDKAPPPAAAVMLEAMSDGKVNGIPLALRSLTINTNETPAGLISRMMKEGREKTALAFLNRAQFKHYFTNWAAKNVRLAMTRFSNLKNRAMARRLDDAGARDWLKQNEMPEVDYAVIETAALSGHIKTNEYFDLAIHDLADILKKKLVDEIRKSMALKKSDPQEHPIAFEPAADLTNRLANSLTKIVLVSAYVDFLKSPLAQGDNFNAWASQAIELGPSSLWRLFRVMTTVMPGKTMFNPETGEILFAGETNEFGETVPRNWKQLTDIQRSDEDVMEIGHKRTEMRIFLDGLYGLWSEFKDQAGRVAEIISQGPDGKPRFHIEDNDFEMNLWIAKGRPTWIGLDTDMPTPTNFMDNSASSTGP